MVRKKVFSGIKYTVFLLLGLFLLWLVFRKVNLTDVVNEFVNANYWWILLSWIFSIISHIARAVRWNILINSLGYKTKTITTFYAVMAGYFANMAVPRLGEIARCGVLSRKDKIPINSLFGSVVAERVFDMIVMLILIFIVIIFQLELVGKFVDKYVLAPMYIKFTDHGLLIVSILILTVAVSIILYRLFIPLIRKLSYFKKIRDFLKGFLDGFKTIQRLKQKRWFIFWTIMIWFNYMMMSYVVFSALTATSDLTMMDALTVLAIGSLGMVAPVPGGLGAYHFFVTLILFELYGIPKTAAASWATLMHASQGILILILGAFSYFMIFSQKQTSNEQITGNTVKNI